jgi:hypothetical protein
VQTECFYWSEKFFDNFFIFCRKIDLVLRIY